MTQDQFVNEILGEAKFQWAEYFSSLPDDKRLRLAGMEEEVQSISRKLGQGLWKLLADSLNTLAVELFGQCDCGLRRERHKGSVHLDVLGYRVEFPCTYLYCRRCKSSVNPVRMWLGLEKGGVSLGFQRALTDLTTRMTFGDAVISMQEHHHQSVDRTKAERITYTVGTDATDYLKQRRQIAREQLNSGQAGVEQLVFTADGGAIPVGEFHRPKTSKEKTAIRGLVKGTRKISGREGRFILVHPLDSKAERVVDCHIAPYENTRYARSKPLIPI